MKKYHGKFTFKTFKFAISLLCCGLFIYFSLDVWNKFSHQFTTTGIRFVDQELSAKQLPCITLCPWAAFKKKAFNYNITNFIANTFDQDELILNSSLWNSDVQLLQVETLNSIYFGRCYMICLSKKMTTIDFLSFDLLKTTDFTGLKTGFKSLYILIKTRHILVKLMAYFDK